MRPRCCHRRTCRGAAIASHREISRVPVEGRRSRGSLDPSLVANLGPPMARAHARLRGARRGALEGEARKLSYVPRRSPTGRGQRLQPLHSVGITDDRSRKPRTCVHPISPRTYIYDTQLSPQSIHTVVNCRAHLKVLATLRASRRWHDEQPHNLKLQPVQQR